MGKGAPSRYGRSTKFRIHQCARLAVLTPGTPTHYAPTRQTRHGDAVRKLLRLALSRPLDGLQRVFSLHHDYSMMMVVVVVVVDDATPHRVCTGRLQCRHVRVEPLRASKATEGGRLSLLSQACVGQCLPQHQIATPPTARRPHRRPLAVRPTWVFEVVVCA